MGSTKHEKSFIDFERPYEQNIIGLKGIFYFGLGLFLLIVVTFGLMWVLIDVLEDTKAEEMREDVNPMAMSEMERLPPEPRVQLAPGFGVDGPNGRINLELNQPQSEYWQLRDQWDQLWREGMRDERTGAVAAMPVEQAKELLLQQMVKARQGPEAQAGYDASRTLIIDSSSGRAVGIKRR
ncbi:MAG: hypothetical protein LC734_06165 [Acidobacteria bacterium]|nr:hypothetical protein [Acidobacteriota bacterium]